MSKNDNMLAILWMLNSETKITAKQIAEKLEINIRTVYRCIDALSVSGVPIISDPGHYGGYSLLSSFTQAPLLFDLEEQKAISHAVAFAQGAGYPFGEKLEGIMTKLKRYSTEDQSTILKQALDGLEIIGDRMPSAVSLFLAQIEAAVQNQQTLEITYLSGREDSSSLREIDPYGVIHWKRQWYTVGFCHRRETVRIFRVDRIQQLNPTGGVFQRPEAFSSREFFLKKLIKDSRMQKEDHTVVFEGHQGVLDDLRHHWYLGHYLVASDSKQATFLLDQGAMESFVPLLILSYGKALKVVEPLSLKKRLVELALEMADYYNE